MISKVVGGIALGAVGVLAVIGVAVGLVDVDPSVGQAVSGVIDAEVIRLMQQFLPPWLVALVIALFRLNHSIARFLDFITDELKAWARAGRERVLGPHDPVRDLAKAAGVKPRKEEEVGGD